MVKINSTFSRKIYPITMLKREYLLFLYFSFFISISYSADYKWDISTVSGYQAGSGTWGLDNYWTLNGTTLVAWPGGGNSASFDGDDGRYTIKISGIQEVDSITFNNNGYILTEGTLDFGTKVASICIPNRNDTAIIQSVIKGAGGLAKYGGGNLILSGNNTYTGPTIVFGGRLQFTTIENGGISCSFGSSSNSASNIVIDGGKIRYIGSGSKTDRLFTLGTLLPDSCALWSSGRGTLIFTNTGHIEFSGNGPRKLEFGGLYEGENIFAPIIGDGEGGPTSILKTGPTKWIFTGNNTYTGTTTIREGTIQLGNGDTTGAIEGDIANSGILIFKRSNSYIYKGVISGTGSVIKSGIGTLILTGNNTYTGNTNIDSGILQIGIGSELGNISSNNIINNGSLVFNRDGEVSYSGTISGGGALTKTGKGTLILSGKNVYTGQTTIAEGKVIITGSIDSSSIKILSGATLEGNGVCRKEVTSVGGNISPGNNSPAKLTLGGLFLDSISILNFDLGGKSDTLIINGDLTLDGTVNFYKIENFTTPSIFKLIKYSGKLTDRDIKVGNVPPSLECKLIIGNGYIDVMVNRDIIKKEPKDTLVRVGSNAIFSVSIDSVTKPTFKWIRLPDGEVVGTDSILILPTVTKEYNNSKFYCIVTAEEGIDTSETAVLTVLDLPIIKSQPKDTSIYYGESFVFTISVEDTNYVKYMWKKVGSDSILSNTNILIFPYVTFSDSGRYFCVVSNEVGSTISDTVILFVETAPPSNVKINVKNEIIREGDTVALYVTKKGTPPFVYSWYKIKENGDTLISHEAEILKIPNISSAEEGKYYCELSNDKGKSRSDTISIFIQYRIPIADFTMYPKSGEAPLRVSFTDASKNIIESRLWDFGDGEISLDKDPVHVYEKEGIYTVKLIVSGPGGSDTLIKLDSIFVYKSGSNPVRLSVRYLFDTRVEITLNNLHEIDTTEPDPVLDSLGIWIKPYELPVSQDEKEVILLKTYSKKEISGREFLIDTITLPSTDSVYGIMSGIFWKDGTISNFTKANGQKVLMRDTVVPENKLVISAEPIMSDSVKIILSNIYSIDTMRIDSLFIWYGTDTLTINPQDHCTHWYSVKSLIKSNEATIILRDTLFTGEARTLYVAVILKGKNEVLSNSKVASFLTVSSYLENPFTINAVAISSTKIKVFWYSDSIEGFDSIRVCYSIAQLVPGVLKLTGEISTVTLPINDTSIIISELLPNTTYYFGILAKKGERWSILTDRSIVKCATPSDSQSISYNPIKIERLYFDSISGQIRVRWCIDKEKVIEIGNKDIEVGIMYSVDQYASKFSGGNVIKAIEECIDTIVRLRESIIFDTLYYVNLWYKENNGHWIEPSERSRGKVRTSGKYREIVSFFDSKKDSVSVFNGMVLIWKDSSYGDKSIIQDTLELFPVEKDSGFIVLGYGLRFLGGKVNSVLPFYVGIRVDSVPEGRKIEEVRIYHKEEMGYYVNYDSKVDINKKIVYVKTNDLSKDFLVMIDTLKPNIEVLSDTGLVVSSVRYIEDSVLVKDNICNVRIWHYYGRGDDVLELRNQEELRGGIEKIRLTISDTIRAISSESGVRSYFILTDGIWIDTVDISRRVMRLNSDAQTTREGMWYPIYSTSDLKKKNIEVLINKLSNDSEPGYDNRCMRIFRWVRYKENLYKYDKWVEYDSGSSEIKALFDLDPGRIIWVKTINNMPIDLDTGITLSLKDTFEIDLEPSEWTDFGIPYRFSVRLDEIVKASGKEFGEQVYIYKWKRDSISGKWYTEPHYVYGIVDKMDINNIELSYQMGGGYSFYNKSKNRIKLRIPPIPSKMLREKVNGGEIAKKSELERWGIKIKFKSDKGYEIPSIYIGYSEGIHREEYPCSRGIDYLRNYIYDRTTGKRYGNYVGEDVKRGIVKEIVLVNEGDNTEMLSYELEKIGDLPSGYEVRCYDAYRREFEEVGKIGLNGGGESSKWLIIGDQKFYEKFRTEVISLDYMLNPLYPNPCRGNLNISFTVPLGSKEEIELTIYNILGKKIWVKRMTRVLKEGVYHLRWDGKDNKGFPIGTGIYFLNMRVIDKRTHKTINTFKHKFTWLK